MTWEANMISNEGGDVIPISDEQRNNLLVYEEGHFGDLKAVDVSPSKMSESSSAFANADGGELWIGVDEDTKTHLRTWRGFGHLEDANAHMQIMETLFPLGASYTYQFLTHEAEFGFVLHIEIGKSRDIVRATSGTAYIRRNAQNIPVSNDFQLRQLERNKGITSYETETIKADPIAITNSATV
jgi:ATP-dependent DNA helicase RecG